MTTLTPSYKLARMSNFAREVSSQPAIWRQVAALTDKVRDSFPAQGNALCMIGCGTSLFIGQAIASYREQATSAWTDAFPASELPLDRTYDAALAISRSGTTTEVLEAVAAIRQRGVPVYAITAVRSSPLTDLVAHPIVLDFADETAIVQTRFATSALLLALAVFCDWDIEASAKQAEHALRVGAPRGIETAEQFVFLGRGLAAGLANEAALKLRESAGVWSEAYPAMEFRHGPISGTGPWTLVWSLDPIDPLLAEAIRATGATLVSGGGDPIAELVRVHLAADHLAKARGLMPDTPRHLTRSVVLPPAHVSREVSSRRGRPAPASREGARVGRATLRSLSEQRLPVAASVPDSTPDSDLQGGEK